MLLSLLLSLTLSVLKPGEPLPWFSTWTPEGQPFNREQLLKTSAKKHLLLLFATWCSPCIKELRALKPLRAELERAELRVWLINLREPKEQLQSWLKAEELDWPLLLDPTGYMSAKPLGAIHKGSLSLPYGLLLDREGQLLKILKGEVRDWRSVLGLALP